MDYKIRTSTKQREECHLRTIQKHPVPIVNDKSFGASPTSWSSSNEFKWIIMLPNTFSFRTIYADNLPVFSSQIYFIKISSFFSYFTYLILCPGKSKWIITYYYFCTSLFLTFLFGPLHSCVFIHLFCYFSLFGKCSSL